MKSSVYIISLFVTLVVMASMIIFSGASLNLFINIPALFVVVAFPLAMLRAGFSFSEMAMHFSNAFGFDPDEAESLGIEKRWIELKQGALFFRTMRTYLLFSGFIGALVGTITMLANLNNKAKLGFGAALVLLTILYALILWALVSLPMRTAIEKKLSLLQHKEKGV